MKHALLSFALLFATPAVATPEDDWAACVIGKAAVILHNQDKKDPLAAQLEAYDQCPMPVGFDGDQQDMVGDFINAALQSMGEGVYGIPAKLPEQ